ncbi:hypothetical protein MRS44_010793 [Fusarium solani]|uniref:uncharacterized protein n=1 Tax=Fusarium solani TaxID=169388 RepID=UPI0032C4457C|nr:hypothetical protein MRS44_010793 [Fusarium solani]
MYRTRQEGDAESSAHASVARPNSTVAHTDFQDIGHLAEYEATSEPSRPAPQVGSTESYISLDDCATTVDDWSLVLRDSLDKQEVVNSSTNELLGIEDDAWANLIGHNTLCRPMPDYLPRWHNDLCLHFSRHIAGEMTAIDGSHNGWRHLVLPFARGNRLVLDAVLTVSAFHIWLNRNPATEFHSPGGMASVSLQAPDPNQLYRRVISGLQQQPELESCSTERKHSILITILVLHVGVMVTGRSDFPMLFRMLESALAAMGGCEALGGGEVADFILPEVAKLRLYAAPLLSEKSGLEVVSSQEHATRLFNCLTHHVSAYPEHSASFVFITDLVQQAINMYLASSRLEAPSALDIADSITRVEHFKETLEAFPPRSAGRTGDGLGILCGCGQLPP